MSVKYIDREIEHTVKDAVRQFPSVIITGPSQSGKTTLLKHLFSESHRYVSMDNPDLRLMAIDEPALFFENYPPPIIIDEIQYTPDIFSYIKIFIDKHRSSRLSTLCLSPSILSRPFLNMDKIYQIFHFFAMSTSNSNFGQITCG